MIKKDTVKYLYYHEKTNNENYKNLHPYFPAIKEAKMDLSETTKVANAIVRRSESIYGKQ